VPHHRYFCSLLSSQGFNAQKRRSDPKQFTVPLGPLTTKEWTLEPSFALAQESMQRAPRWRTLNLV
jgi:hypothetical protein